jgi:osmotically-inducible protein OsmY
MRRPAGSVAAHGDYPGSGYSGGGRSGGMYSGGTGGYDYERGYGDAGRTENRGEGFEDRARDAGDFLRRAGQRISHWFSEIGDRDDNRREETYRGARGLGPKGYKRSDERISDDVHQRLADDPWLDASNVNVSVSGGEVTLSGTVDSREAKHRAERIVEDLSGVNHVQNNLRIDRGSYFTSAGRGYGDSANEAAMASSSGQTSTGLSSSQSVKDVTDGASASPPAQKRN